MTKVKLPPQYTRVNSIWITIFIKPLYQKRFPI